MVSRPERLARIRSTTRAARSVAVTFIARSDVGAEHLVVHVAVAPRLRVHVDVLHLPVGAVGEGAALAPDPRPLVATEPPPRIDQVAVVHPHRAGTHAGGDRLRPADAGRPHST